MTLAWIDSLVYKPRYFNSQPADHFSRFRVAQVRLIERYGIEGDMKGGHANRQLLIVSGETLDKLAEVDFKITPGALGEQLTLRGLPVDTLTPGTLLLIGERALVEITEARCGGSRLDAVQGLDTAALNGQLGMFAKVIASGIIREDDPITVIEPEYQYVGIRYR